MAKLVLQIIARILSAGVSIYMVLCFLRVLSSWLPGVDLGKPGELLATATDPFLGLFSRVSWLHVGSFDFSPIAALALLTLVNSILTTLAFSGTISLGIILGMVLAALWAAVGFILSFFAICALVRIIVAAAHWNGLHPVWRVVDSMLNPILYRINRIIYRNRIVNYLQSLVTGFVVLVVLRVAGGELVNLLVRLLNGLPF
jgi:YggT family protein